MRRVLLVGARCAADSMESHVLDALRALGCETAFFGTEPALGRFGNAVWTKIGPIALREPERLCEQRLLRAAAEFAPELVLVLQGNQLSPKSVEALRARTNAMIVCWCQDAVSSLGRQFVLSGVYEHVFLKDRYLLGLCASMIRSGRFHYLAEACNPRVHRSLALSEEDRSRYGCELVVVGSVYYYRQEILRQLGEFDLRIWGNQPGWLLDRHAGRHMRREAVLDDKVRAVRAARIALNPLHYAEVDALNCRAFELAGCGAFQLISQRPVLGEHFVVGQELDSYATAEELIEKIRHYLRHPEAAAAIAERGQRRAHAEHSYEARLRELLDVVFAPSTVAA